MFSIQQAAEQVGISEGLLILWISTKRIVPTGNLTTAGSSIFDKYPALKNYAPDGELFGWSRYAFSDADIERLRSIVEVTATQRTKTESTHVKGSDYTVQELASLWSLGVDKIRELFEHEPDVLKIRNPPKKGKRQYVTLRIPEKVAERVKRRNS